MLKYLAKNNFITPCTNYHEWFVQALDEDGYIKRKTFFSTISFTEYLKIRKAYENGKNRI